MNSQTDKLSVFTKWKLSMMEESGREYHTLDESERLSRTLVQVLLPQMLYGSRSSGTQRGAIVHQSSQCSQSPTIICSTCTFQKSLRRGETRRLRTVEGAGIDAYGSMQAVSPHFRGQEGRRNFCLADGLGPTVSRSRLTYTRGGWHVGV